MSYTVKNSEVSSKLALLSGFTGEKYRVVRNTDWETFELQFLNGRVYESIIDWSELSDVISHIDGMLHQFEKKQNQALEIVETIENQKIGIIAFGADNDGFVVRHGDVLGLYQTNNTYGDKVGSLVNAYVFPTLEKAQAYASVVYNGNNDVSKAYPLKEECVLELEKLNELISKLMKK